MNREPNVELLELTFQPLFEIDEKAAVLGRIFGIYEDAIELVSKFDATLMPDALDDLRFPRSRAKVPLDFNNASREQRLRHARAVIKPQRQEELEATICAHKLPDLRQ